MHLTQQIHTLDKILQQMRKLSKGTSRRWGHNQQGFQIYAKDNKT